MSSMKFYGSLKIVFFTGILIMSFAGTGLAEQNILQPVFRGKEALPDAIKGPGIESLDAFESEPEKEKKISEDHIQERFLQALGMDDVVQAEYLISKGEQVNLPLVSTGSTALMLAQSLSMARMLVLNGADVHARDNKNGTSLHYAVTRPAATDLILFLVKSGSDINARGWENETPFNIAVSYLNETRTENMEIVKVLAESGADINSRDNNGFTGLMQAAATGNNALADMLISLGANKALTDPYGKTARDIAYEFGSRYIWQQLE